MPRNVRNYLKLTVHASRPLHDADAIPQAPSGEWPLVPHGYEFNGKNERRTFATTWVFAFTSFSKASETTALAAAQEKRKQLRAANKSLSASAFQLSTWQPSSLRGVLVVGSSIRPQLELAEAS